MWETVDPEGRRVVLTDGTWAHILDDHEELADELDAILRCIETLTHRATGRSSDEERFCLAGHGPSRYVKVVVRYEGGEGRVVTAFPRRAFP